MVAANRVNKHGLLFGLGCGLWTNQGVMGYMFLVPYFLIGSPHCRVIHGWQGYIPKCSPQPDWLDGQLNRKFCSGCAVPLWWSWDSYQEMAASSGFDANTLNMQLSMVTSPALMLLGVAITAALAILGTLFGQRLLRKHFKSRHCRMMAEEKAKRIDRIDGRTVLFLTLCACIVTFLATSFLGHGCFTF